MTEVREYYVQTCNFSAIMPRKAKVLRVHVQDGQVRMYVLVQAWSPEEPRAFAVLRGGEMRGEEMWKYTYIDTFKPGDGQPLCHLFDMTPPDGPLEQLAACGT